MPALGRTFDYEVPPDLVHDVRVGTLVRIPLHGRRVGGWVVDLPAEAATSKPLLSVTRVTGWGPSPELIDLAAWAAWRWAGRTSAILGTASPPRAVRALPRPVRPVLPVGAAPGAADGPGRAATTDSAGGHLAAEAFSLPVAVVRLGPASDIEPLLLAAARFPDPLVLLPSVAAARFAAARLRAAGLVVALVPEQWAQAAAGGCVAVGTRAAAWAPRPSLGAVLVVDEHEEAYQQEQAPTWNARDVAVERARRSGVPVVLTSPCPSLESLVLGPELVPSRAEERAGWAAVDVVDRRAEAPGLGLWSERLVALVRAVEPGRRVVCVLNRKGRARLVVCAKCGEVARCEACGSALEAGPGVLRCPRAPGHEEREAFCLHCGGTRMKALRVGVTGAADQLALLTGRRVDEVTAETPQGPPPPGDVLVGTEAVLHRVAGAALVAFLDFDQEALAPRYRAVEHALGLLARASRLVGGREGGGRVVVQTRLPSHEALEAAVHADPSRLAAVERARRVALRLPPETALALVSGAAAAPFVAEVATAGDVEVLGPRTGGRWLLRAPDHSVLCDRLAATPRPPGRLRVEVDPLGA